MKFSAVSRSFLQKALCFVLLACLITGCAVIVGGRQTAYAEEGAVLSAADLYEQNVNSTVGITISGETTSSRYGYGRTYEASGSGFIVTSDGYILTNYHVISGSKTVTVATYDQQTYDAKVVGYDADNDIAVIKIEAEGLKPVTLGNSDSLRVGEEVYAIGNPLGELTFSLTHGIISALSRSVRVDSSASMNLIQTDCSINSGNSGGALFNDRGEVIGITNAKYSSSGFSEAEIDNIGFAIPINNVKRIVTSIIENGYILKPYIGVSVSALSEETAGITGLKAGAVVQDVTADAPADKAGIKLHDVIVRVGDTPINTTSDLVQVISRSDPGDVMTFCIYRQGEEIKIDVEIGSRTESALKDEEEAATDAPDAQQPSQGWGDQGGQYGWGDQGGQYGWGDQDGQYYGWGDSPLEDFFEFYFGN